MKAFALPLGLLIGLAALGGIVVACSSDDNGAAPSPGADGGDDGAAEAAPGLDV